MKRLFMSIFILLGLVATPSTAGIENAANTKNSAPAINACLVQ